MKSFKTNNLRVFVFAVGVAWVFSFFLPLIQTLLSFLEIEFEKPLSAYYFLKYSPLVFAAIYLGYQKVRNPLFCGLLVGVCFKVIMVIFYKLLAPPEINFPVSFNKLVIDAAIYALICSASTWLFWKLFNSEKISPKKAITDLS